MKLILVRHGETEFNVLHLVQGKEGGKLTQKGIEQVKETGRHLKEHHKIDMIFCSPMERCVETLNNILEEYPIEGEIFMSKLIEERDFGEYEGTSSDAIDWDEIDKDSKINEEMGVESMSDFQKRIYLFLEDLKLENEDSTILVISHKKPIKMIVNKLTGKNFEEIKIGNGEMVELDYDTGLKY